MVEALMVSSSFLPGRGGIESYLAELCADLRPRLAVLAPAEREGRQIPADLGYPTFGYPGSMLVPNGRVVDEIARRCDELGTKKVLFGTPWPLALLGPRLAERGLRYAVVIHGAEMLVPSVVPAVKGKLARALSMSDLLLPVSEYTGRQAARFLEREGRDVPEMEVLRAKVDLRRFSPEAASDPGTRARFGLPDDAPVLLCFGRLVKRKGVDRAIRAVHEVSKTVPGTTLAIAGTGPELKALQRLARSLAAPVRFLGRVPDEAAPAVYATADVFLLPVVDRWRGLEVEGLGVVLLEAGACETPSVTGRSGGTPEAVIDGTTGYVIDATREEDLVERVLRLLRDEDLRNEMGVAARKHVQDHFSDRRVPVSLLH